MKQENYLKNYKTVASIYFNSASLPWAMDAKWLARASIRIAELVTRTGAGLAEQIKTGSII